MYPVRLVNEVLHGGTSIKETFFIYTQCKLCIVFDLDKSKSKAIDLTAQNKAKLLCHDLLTKKKQ